MCSTNRFRGNAVFTLFALLFAGMCPAQQQSTAHLQASRAQRVKASNMQLADPNIERRVNELLRRMTLDEKIGQLVQYSASQAASTGPTSVSRCCAAQIALTPRNDMPDSAQVAKLND